MQVILKFALSSFVYCILIFFSSHFHWGLIFLILLLLLRINKHNDINNNNNNKINNNNNNNNNDDKEFQVAFPQGGSSSTVSISN